VGRLAPLAARVYGTVANPRVRNTATVGGNLVHGDYRLDPPGALMVLDARVELTSAAGRRVVPARELFVGFQTTAVRRVELLTAVWVPAQPVGGSAYVKLSSLSANDWPCASACALVVPGPRGRMLRLALGALAERPVHRDVALPPGATVTDAEQAARDAAEELMDPLPDVRGGVAFKRRLGLAAVRDAVREAWAATPTDLPGGTTRKEDGDVGRTLGRWRRGR
jgi:carbon-monoxide dehydrogenase medium subunit